jgi:hypothetical protein
VPCITTYHTDFAQQVKQIVGDASICRFVEDFTRWFHSLADKVFVPTDYDMDLLEQRGYRRDKMVRFAQEYLASTPTLQKIA